MDDIYDRRCKKIWTHLVETPYDSYVDLEDIDNKDKLILKRYYKHSSDWCHYLEFDERLLTHPKPLLDRKVSPTHDYYIQGIMGAYRDVANKRYYMRYVAFCETENMFFHETWVNGIHLDQREQNVEHNGRDYKWDKKEMPMGRNHMVTFFDE